MKFSQIGGAHLQYVNNHYTKFEYKGIKHFGDIDYSNWAHRNCCGRSDGVYPLLELHFGDASKTNSTYSVYNHCYKRINCLKLLWLDRWSVPATRTAFRQGEASKTNAPKYV